jgi:O-antigen/teichoic acid export membrane protein
VPKALGPNLYGVFGYINSILESIINFFRVGIFQAYYNYNSSNNNSFHINKWILMYSFVAITVIGIITIITINYFSEIVWNNASPYIIYTILLLIISREIFSVVNDYGHSKSLTLPVQKIKIATLTCQMILVAIFYKYDLLNIISFCLIIITMQIFFKIFAYRLFRSRKVIGITPNQSKKYNYSELTKYFYRFSSPLLTLAFFSSIAIFFDRWFLQKLSGSIDQAYFHFADRLSVMVLMVNSAIIPIMQKDLVNVFNDKDFSIFKKKYVKYLKIFSFISCLLIIAISFNIETIIDLLLDQRFSGAYNVILLVMIATVFRFFGQFYSVLLLSMNRTSPIRNVGFITLTSGYLLTIMLVGNNSNFFGYGLNLGAIGLAIKLLSVEIINFTILYIIVKNYLQMTHKVLVEMGVVILILITSMYLSITIIEKIMFLFTINNHFLISLASIVLYIFIIVWLVYRYPNLFGISRNEILKLNNSFRSK